MPDFLPTGPVKATKKNPKLVITYGMPKIGKTTMIAKLEDCLIEDMEDGASSFENMRVPVKYINGPTVWEKDKNGEDILKAISFTTVMNQIMVYAKEYQIKNPGQKVPYRYRRICIDTGDKFEELCLAQALINYKATAQGKDTTITTITELPYGLGYYYIRDEFLTKIDLLCSFCETLILNCHTKDNITSVGGLEFTAKDLSLGGKLGAMVAAKADVIIYWYRNLGSKTMMASLQTVENNGVMGARDFPHLKELLGTKFEFSWEKILVDPTAK